ncbi:hypothetical protein [Nostoc sp. WHI]|uniref:hypothetical protein n=1 Tax=Nostoc sp. WHI TaxID=2650611 RepID=UPI0018C6425A|nr:hypothetical protein [Nostoc sp. WHI]MBG1267064.1 hypothetical protein [Nostoc sp. WHI]
MPRQKRTSRVLEKAVLRSASLRAIDPSMDFGDARNLTNLIELMAQLRTKINEYNTALTVVDSYKSEIDELEKTLNNLSDQMLLGIAFKYGKDSSEYEMAGGVRKRERIRRSVAGRLKAVPDEVSSNDTQTA